MDPSSSYDFLESPLSRGVDHAGERLAAIEKTQPSQQAVDGIE